MPCLKGKIAIITGASSGIGAKTAEHFASLGASLIIAGRNAENLSVVKTKCIEAGGTEKNIVLSIGDVTDDTYAKTLVDTAISSFSRIDILVNSAGILVFGPLSTLPISEFDRVNAANVRSVILLCQQCIPHLIKTKGSIVNVSSICGQCSFAQSTYHCMSKAALDQLTKCLALELAPQGVRVNSVNPGVIITNIQKRSGMSDQEYAEYIDNMKKMHPLGRVGEAIEVAKAIAFLASDDASFTTGELFPIEGGRRIVTPR